MSKLVAAGNPARESPQAPRLAAVGENDDPDEARDERNEHKPKEQARHDLFTPECRVDPPASIKRGRFTGNSPVLAGSFMDRTCSIGRSGVSLAIIKDRFKVGDPVGFE